MPRPLARRELFTRPLDRLAASLSPATLSGAVPSGAIRTGDLTAGSDDRALYMLRRLTYGPTPEARAELERIGEKAWLARQLDPLSFDTSEVEAALADLPALGMTGQELDTSFVGAKGATQAGVQLMVAWVVRAVLSPAQLHERMVEFWSDHFNVPMVTRATSLLKIVEDRDVIRPNAFGSFADLLVASAQSPAMLVYLDNASSRAGAPNENYSRELLELHTVGRGGGYSEDDVVALARLLTGWTVDRTSSEFRFREKFHDPSPLSIMGWNRPSGDDHLQHGVDFLRWLATRPATARFVCTKLARRFVSDDPSDSLVETMAAAWETDGTAIPAVIRAMVSHDDFGPASGAKFRRPLDQLVFVLRALRAELRPSDRVVGLTELRDYLVALGQMPFGWPAPNGYPDVEEAWLNAGGLLSRWNLAGDVVAGSIPAVEVGVRERFAPLAGRSPREVYDIVADETLLDSITAAGRDVLDQATGWGQRDIITAADLDGGIELLVTALLASSASQYR